MNYWESASSVVPLFTLDQSSLIRFSYDLEGGGVLGDVLSEVIDAQYMGRSPSYIVTEKIGYVDNNDLAIISSTTNYVTITATPVPAAIWLLGSGLLGLVGIRRKLIKES